MEGSGQEDGSLESLLQEYEELFKHRYTEQDEDYMKTANMPNPAPPCVENWYTRPKRNFDYTRFVDIVITVIWTKHMYENLIVPTGLNYFK